MDYQRVEVIILAYLDEHPQGASIQDIEDALQFSIPRRSLQRRLHEMIAQGQVEKWGKGKAVHYRLATQPKVLIQAVDVNATDSLKAYLAQDLIKRKPVGYNRAFLESYKPNESYYLPVAIRERLHHIGTPSKTDQLAGTFAKTILDQLLIDLSWNSSRLEGNTYSLLETEKLILFNDESKEKNYFETQMILNHKKAIQFLVIHSESVQFDRMTICNLHAFLANNLLSNATAVGRIRQVPVGIGKTAYQPSSIIPLIDECFGMVLEKAQQIADPFEQAFFVMVHLPYLQPFADVNKRVSRLSANIPLIKNNLAPLSFIDVPQEEYINGLLAIYELNRVELMIDVFIWAYERSANRYLEAQAVIGEPDKFRLQYQEALEQMIKNIVMQEKDKGSATSYLQHWSATHIPKHDRTHFVGMVETELLALHSGSIFRFGITLAQFEKWQRHWR